MHLPASLPSAVEWRYVPGAQPTTAADTTSVSHKSFPERAVVWGEYQIGIQGREGTFGGVKKLLGYKMVKDTEATLYTPGDRPFGNDSPTNDPVRDQQLDYGHIIFSHGMLFV